MPMKRRDARELAFTFLFEQSFADEPVLPLIAAAEVHREVTFDAFARSLCIYVTENRDAIDEKIAHHATRWSVGRLPRVTLTLLRMCIAEMDAMEEVPVSVSINEAVELCKRFATEEDAAFLNGVLGAYAKGGQVRVDLPRQTTPEVEPDDEVFFADEEGEESDG